MRLKKSFYYKTIHFLEGFIANTISFLLYLVYPKFGILTYITFILMFLVYQIDEQLRLKDRAYLDILYFTIGIAVNDLYIMALSIPK